MHEGQEIVVQVVKDPIGSKGARLTTQISIPSRYLVLLPYSRVIGVSARIEDEAERLRLKAIMAGLVNGSAMGYIVRTNAEGQSEQALAEDVAYLLSAYGIELDADLVGVARGLAQRYDSNARFVAGSFVPTGYRWKSRTGDDRIGTIGYGQSGYPELQHPLEDFDIVFAYPWHGEEPMMLDLMRTYGGSGARLVLHGGPQGVRIYRGGKLLP